MISLISRLRAVMENGLCHSDADGGFRRGTFIVVGVPCTLEIAAVMQLRDVQWPVRKHTVLRHARKMYLYLYRLTTASDVNSVLGVGYGL